MRISDWSSDVCSSDLSALALPTRLMIPRLVAVLRAARAGFGLAGGAVAAPFRAHTIKVGLEHGGGLMIGNAVVIDQFHQRRQVELREQRASVAPVEDAAVEVTAVMVERSEEHTSELPYLMRNSN